MTNFVLRLLKRKVVDKTKARPRPAHRDDASSDDDDADDEGFHESKFDYDEGVSTSVDSIDQLSFAHHDNGLVGHVAQCSLYRMALCTPSDSKTPSMSVSVSVADLYSARSQSF